MIWRLSFTACALLLAQDPRPAPVAPTFAWPCANYLKGLQDGGNFGTYVDAKASPFHGSWHLAEDVWLPGGTEVRAIADGVVTYSAFSPTWTDEKGGVHWNLGNVIVVEHTFAAPIGDLSAVCSFYVHLAADRRVKVGDTVKTGQVLGRIGADKSEENGRYPAHLHFGIHRGPYVQIPPAFERELRKAARSKAGLVIGPYALRGELEIRRRGQTDVAIRDPLSKGDVVLSLLVASTAPKDPPPDIMCWCEGYGARETLDEWLQPSAFLRARGAH